MTRPPSFPAADEIVAWHAHIDVFQAQPETRARAEQLLLAPDRSRLERYRHETDRAMFLLGRAMARSMVGRSLGVAASAWEWHEGPHGRPQVRDPACAIRFSVAHSAGLVTCAVAREREVGVDVEDLQRRPPDPLVVTRYCSPREAADIHGVGQESWPQRFLSYWTLKEAYLKARGLGISVPLSEIEFALNGAEPRIAFRGSLAGTDDRWRFHLERIGDRYLLALAAPGAEPPLSFVVMPMPEDVL
jgi:4'-phosphopantetheinyl transferase